LAWEVSLHAKPAQELTDVEKELTSLIAKVQKGHLIELQEICGDWGPFGTAGPRYFNDRVVGFEKQPGGVGPGTCKKSPQ